HTVWNGNDTRLQVYASRVDDLGHGSLTHAFAVVKKAQRVSIIVIGEHFDALGMGDIFQHDFETLLRLDIDDSRLIPAITVVFGVAFEDPQWDLVVEGARIEVAIDAL